MNKVPRPSTFGVTDDKFRSMEEAREKFNQWYFIVVLAVLFGAYWYFF